MDQSLPPGQGVRQAQAGHIALRDVLTLLKPITWFPPMWAFACGAIASGQQIGGKLDALIIGILLAGPLVCAMSQAVNDWFDRFVDAINEPNRPIPSGRLPGRVGLYIAWGWTALSLAVSLLLGPIGFAATGVGVALAWAYSAPPFRFKENGWIGNLVCGLCYEGLAWVTGAIVLSGGQWPSNVSLLLALLYSVATHGIMTLNDFKAIDGDRRMGVRSLPVQLGPQGAAQVACLLMLLPQVIVIYLMREKSAHCLALIGLLVGQIALMRVFLSKPIEKALFYSGFGVPLFVAGMMVSAFGIRAGM